MLEERDYVKGSAMAFSIFWQLRWRQTNELSL